MRMALGPEALEVVGRSVRVRIPVGSTSEEVYAVPIAALRADAEGDVWVEVLLDDDSTRWVEVRVGMEASGLVEVEPLGEGLPSPAWVVVGRRANGQPRLGEHRRLP